MAVSSIEDILDLVEILRAGVRATTAQASLSLYDAQLIKKTYPGWRDTDPLQQPPRWNPVKTVDKGSTPIGSKLSLPFTIYLGEGFSLGGYVRREPGRGFTRRDQSTLTGLVAPLEDVARVLLKGFRHGCQDSWATALSDDMGRESFVLDTSLQVVFRSPHIETFLGDGREPTVFLPGRFDWRTPSLALPQSVHALVGRFVRSDLSRTTFSLLSGEGRPMTVFARRVSLPEEPHETFFAFAIQGAVVDFRTMAERLREEARLTAREMEIAEQILRGTPYLEICDVLCISRDTLKSHSRHIFRKTGVRNRTELITSAIGLLSHPTNNRGDESRTE